MKPLPTFEMFNGNGQTYTRELPLIFWQTSEINETALAHIKKQTGLLFIKTSWGYQAQPESFDQYMRLFLTYNFKTRYYNNATHHNTLFIKSDHHVGFDVDSICYMCAKENRITTNGLAPHERLSC